MSERPEYCRHYNIGDNWRNTKCNAGVEYAKVRSPNHPGNNSPCYNPEIRHLCPLWQPETEEQLKALEAANIEMGKFIENFAAMLKGENKNCLHCGQAVEKLKKDGRCVYARPCGCRQYQGEVPESWEGE